MVSVSLRLQEPETDSAMMNLKSISDQPLFKKKKDQQTLSYISSIGKRRGAVPPTGKEAPSNKGRDPLHPVLPLLETARR